MSDPALRKPRLPRRVERPPRTSEVVAASIRGQIARGELKPGDRFPSEVELMDFFGIARTTLREALRILESEGLVEILRGRRGGPRVTRPQIDHIGKAFALLLQLDGVAVGDVYRARSLVEPQLARMLAVQSDPATVATLRDEINRAAEAADANDHHAFAEAATAIHQIIVERAGNATLALVAKLLHDLVARFYEQAGGLASQEDLRRAVRSYRKLLTFIENGDGAGAEAHWSRQMMYTGRGDVLRTPIDVL